MIGLTHLPRVPAVTTKPIGPGELTEIPGGRVLAHIRTNAPVMLFPGSGQPLRYATAGASGTALVVHLTAARGEIRLAGRRYPGSLYCWQAGNQIVCALDTAVEEYLCGVVPGEVPASWPLETQKALAVAARSYAQASRGKHAAEGFDLCDSTDCQMYLGYVSGAARSVQAVRQTRGLVALYGGQPIRAFYSSDCGGRTANNEDVPFPDNPPEPLPYLRSVADTPWPGGPHYCARGRSQHWTRWLSAAEIESALNADPETAVGTLRSLQVTAMDDSGRVKAVRVEGAMRPIAGVPSQDSREGVNAKDGVTPLAAQANGALVSAAPMSPPEGDSSPPAALQTVTRTMAGYAFRRAVGPRLLKSTRFTVTQVSPTLFRVTGAGNGHGLGLCQIGARGMALPPYRCSFRQILAHYYQGVTIAPFHPMSDPP